MHRFPITSNAGQQRDSQHDEKSCGGGTLPDARSALESSGWSAAPSFVGRSVATGRRWR
jgi:hypothetical protein